MNSTTKKRTISIIPGHARIVAVAKDNPHAPGTVAFRTFTLYRRGLSVGRFRVLCRERGGDYGYLPVDVARGLVRVSDAE